MSEGVLVIGAANLDIKGRLFHSPVPRSSNAAAIKTSMGGVARNVAENLARLGTPVTLLTAVGGDYAGEDIIDTCDEVGIDVSRALVIEDEPTGTYLAALDGNGDMFIGLDDVRVLRHLSADYLYLNRDAFRECNLVALDLNLSDTALHAALNMAREYRKPVCVDPTSTDIAHRITPFLSQIEILTPNVAEAEAILKCGEIHNGDDALNAGRQLAQLGVKIAVITQAELGACFASDQESGQFPALRGDIVDTTGAGDALTATVIFGYLQGFSVSESLKLGLRAAALTLRSSQTVAPDLSLDHLYGLDDEFGLDRDNPQP